MSDITFSMSADDKDVVRALQNSGKEFGKLREQIMSLAQASDAQGKAEINLSQQRLAALNPLIGKQRELKAAMDDAKKQLAEGKITQEQYTAAVISNAQASDSLTQQLRKLQTQVQEDAADMKKAATIIGTVEDKTEKYKRAVVELDRMKAKGILTAKQHAAALEAERKALAETGNAADKSGGMIGGLTSKMSAFVAGLAGSVGVVAMLRAEYQNLLEVQGKSKNANINLAGQQEALLMNLGGADAGGVLNNIQRLSKRTGVKEENITAAVNDAMAARADLGVDQVVNAVGSVSKIRKFAPTEMAGLAAATIDTQKQTGLGTDQSLGFLLQLQGQARTKSLKFLAENMTPAVGGVMNFGADRQTAGAMLSALSHGMGDTTGAMSATSAIQLSKQLREFAPGQDIGMSIEALQNNPEMRAKFLGGASFEAKALPAIESLLGGGVQAKQFAAARTALSADPMLALNDAIKSRDASGAIPIAEKDMRLGNITNQMELNDKQGAMSSVFRERLSEMKRRTEGAVSGQIDDLLRDFQGQSPQSSVRALERIRSGNNRQMLESMKADGVVTAEENQNRLAMDKLFLEMIIELQNLNRTNEKQLAAQQQNVHAGAAVGRRNNQGEGAP
jgi:hypothetical protein